LRRRWRPDASGANGHRGLTLKVQYHAPFANGHARRAGTIDVDYERRSGVFELAVGQDDDETPRAVRMVHVYPERTAFQRDDFPLVIHPVGPRRADVGADDRVRCFRCSGALAITPHPGRQENRASQSDDRSTPDDSTAGEHRAPRSEQLAVERRQQPSPLAAHMELVGGPRRDRTQRVLYRLEDCNLAGARGAGGHVPLEARLSSTVETAVA
jgi:hypothetical protein